MGNEPHNVITAAFATAGPLTLLAFGLAPLSLFNRKPIPTARAGSGVALTSFGLAIGAVVARAWLGPCDVRLALAGPFHLSIYFDNLSAILLSLVAFLLAVVSRFSVNYLAGDPAQGRFTKWFCITGASALGVVICGNLVQFAIAWAATSLSLHQLLVLYPERPGAILAARKKFLISRLGDGCLLAVIVLVSKQCHTWDFTGIFNQARQWHEGSGSGAGLAVHAICFLLVAGAMLKSAQFPFHSWLPDTMETPTPVSALMHAGIINAGGFLIIRLSPLLTLSPAAMTTLALFGAVTALFASMVMLTHASVKRSLAFSTVAQMGYMMLECGLGAFPLAVLHLVAHSLYKAHAFLASGSAVEASRPPRGEREKKSAHLLTILASVVAATALTLGCAFLFGVDVVHSPSIFVLGCTFAMTLASALWNLLSRSINPKRTALGLVFGGGLAALYFSLHTIFDHLLGGKIWVNAWLSSRPGMFLAAILLALFLIVLVIQTQLQRWGHQRFLQAAYVHARNGFYFSTLANRTVGVLWPVKPAPAKN